jgi:hypothetical protein
MEWSLLEADSCSEDQEIPRFIESEIFDKCDL